MDVQSPNSNVESVRPLNSGRAARTSHGIVKPHPLKWYQRLVASIIYGLIEAVAFTQRWKREYHPEAIKPGTGPFIFCVWHNRLPLCLILYRHYLRHKNLPHRMAAIVSASKDGGVVARIIEHFGVQPVRGSSSRRGPQALLELTTWAERGYDLAFTPDGPRGPRYVVQAGAIALAQVTGLPLAPASYHLRWKICLKSWDRFQIPLPFGRVEVKMGEPMHVPRDASDEQRERLRQEFERRLRALTVD